MPEIIEKTSVKTRETTMSIVIDKNDIDLASTQLFKTYGITVNMLHKLYSLQWHQDAEHIHKKLHKDDKSEISSVKGIA